MDLYKRLMMFLQQILANQSHLIILSHYRMESSIVLSQPSLYLQIVLDFYPFIILMILTPQIINKATHYINHANERELDLRSKNIGEINSLVSTLNYFQAIDLSNNSIKSLTNIPYLDRLKTLVLVGNNICEIGNIGEFLPSLQNLFLMNNRLKDIKQVQKLGECRQLSNLVLNNNPICEMMHYRKSVIVSIVTLKQLDFKKITPEEREKANRNTKY